MTFHVTASNAHFVFWKGPRRSECSAALKRRPQDTRSGWMLDFFIGQLLALERVVGWCELDRTPEAQGEVSFPSCAHESVDFPFLEVFQARVNGAWSNLG